MKADMMLYPPPHDFRETYGIAFLEAQASNTLCFYRENGALGETIGARGVPLQNDMTPEQIVDKVVGCIMDVGASDRLRKAGREYAMKRDWSTQTDKILSLYRRVNDEQD